jgi:hypothetical protein
MEFNELEYKFIKQDAKALGIFTAYSKMPKGFEEYNGVTVAFRLSAPNVEDPRMLHVAVSYCAPEDKFKKKIGKFNALDRMLVKEEVVQLPLAKYFQENGPEETGELLTHIFSV